MKQEECSNCGLVQYGFTSKDLKYRMSIHKLSKKCKEVFKEETEKSIPSIPNEIENQKEVQEDV